MVIITAVLFSVFDQINLGQEIRQDMLIELMDEYEGEEDQLKERIASLGEKQKDDYMRKYLNHRYISFETLNESRSFFPLADLGKSLVPTLRDVDTQIRGEVDGMVNDVLEDIDEKDIDLW